MARELQQRIYPAYSNVFTVPTNPARGLCLASGLGLSLIRLIVEFYGGTVWLESAGVQQGTAAFVRWPVG